MIRNKFVNVERAVRTTRSDAVKHPISPNIMLQGSFSFDRLGMHFQGCKRINIGDNNIYDAPLYYRRVIIRLKFCEREYIKGRGRSGQSSLIVEFNYVFIIIRTIILYIILLFKIVISPRKTLLYVYVCVCVRVCYFIERGPV